MSTHANISAVLGYSVPEEVETIIRSVLREFRTVTLEDLIQPGRSRRVVEPRFWCYFFLRTRTLLSSTRIGRMFGRDHKCVLEGAARVQAWIDTSRRDESRRQRINQDIMLAEVEGSYK